MVKRFVLAFLFALLPATAGAQTIQESYLPSKSQIYFRFDGMQMHQAAFDQTAVGKMMKGDTGKFLVEFWKYVEENIQTAARNEPKVGPMLKDFTKLLGSMHQNGIIFAAEMEMIAPNPSVQAVMVFPKGAGETGTLLPLVTKIAEETKAKVKSEKVGKRFVNQVEVEMVKFGWWAQGEDAVLYLGTNNPSAYAKNIDSKKTGIASNPLYKKVVGFKEFKTASRGFIDVNSILTVVANDFRPAGEVIDELGVRGIKNITFVSGFDGPAERSVVDVDMPGPRKGLLSFTTQKKISMKDLPVLPSDLRGFSASAIKLDKTFTTITGLVEGVARVFDANAADQIKDAIKNFEGVIGKGFDFDKDLFGAFGDVLVSYNSPSDGFLGTGAVVAIQLKDGKKLSKTLDKLVNAIPPANPIGKVELKRTQYHGGEMIQLQLSGPQIKQHLGTFGIYKGWFVYAQYPQPIKGFILRQEGELPAWKADESLTKALSHFPKEFTSIQVSDPRPTVQTVISILPFAFNLMNTFGSTPFLQGYRPFDLELIPHAQEATRHLFPNVTVSVDDGKHIRSETRGSLILPFGL